MLKQRQFHIFAAVRGLSYSIVFGIMGVIALAFLFIKLSDDVVEREYGSIDRDIMLAIHSTTTDLQTRLIMIITNFGSPYLIVLAVISLALGGYIYWRNRQHEEVGIIVTVIDTVAPAFSLAGATLLNFIVKGLVGRMRPDIFPPLVPEVGFSFPSGHVMASIAFYGMVAFLLGRSRTLLQRVGITIVTVLIVSSIAYSRMYLGVHYPTDVFGSVLLGSAWLISAIIGLRLIEKNLRAVHHINQVAEQAAAVTPPSPQPAADTSAPVPLAPDAASVIGES